MKIVLTIHHRLSRNAGAPGVTLDFAEQLTKQGHKVRVISFDDLQLRLPERVAALLFPLLVAWRLLCWRPAIVDASTGDAAAIIMMPRVLRPFVVVTRSHGLEPLAWRREKDESITAARQISFRRRLYMNLCRVPMVNLTLRRSDGVIALNQDEADYLKRLGARAIIVSANGIPDHLAPEPHPTELPIDAITGIAFVGSYIARKGIDVLATATSELFKNRDDVRLGLFGTGADQSTILSDYSKCIHSRISVVPQFERSELPRLLADYDILACPSFFEGASIALLEGMACGLAPVVTEACTSGVVRDGINGLVVQTGDAKAFERALKRLVGSPKLRRQLASAAQQTAREHTWSIVCERIASWYSELLYA